MKSLLPTLFVTGISVSGCMATHNQVSDSHVMDEARARRVLATVPGFDMTQIWFATGSEYWSSGTCLRGRDIEAFTKPQLSSSGIWRGKKLFVKQPMPGSNSKCANPEGFDYNPNFAVTTVTFADPEQMHPEEAGDGAVPGVFEVRDGITDDELRKVALTIDQTYACLKKESVCSYPVNRETDTNLPDYELIPAIKTENLLGMSIDDEYKTGKPCYSMVFQTNYGGAFGMDICYRNEAVTKVDVGSEVIE